MEAAKHQKLRWVGPHLLAGAVDLQAHLAQQARHVNTCAQHRLGLGQEQARHVPRAEQRGWVYVKSGKNSRRHAVDKEFMLQQARLARQARHIATCAQHAQHQQFQLGHMCASCGTQAIRPDVAQRADKQVGTVQG